MLYIVPRPLSHDACLNTQFIPLFQRGVLGWWNRVLHGHDWVLELEVAAGREGIESGLHNFFGGGKAGEHSSGVNVLEGLFEKPFVFSVVDFEGAVRRDAEGVSVWFGGSWKGPH
jgi:hypothetical protein